MPGFDQVLLAVVDAWTNRRGTGCGTGRAARRAPAAASELRRRRPGDIDARRAATGRDSVWPPSFDPQHGGFGQCTEFPQPIDLQVLLRVWHRERNPHTLHMVRLTLDQMAAGGMYDHLGGGFARYSVDDRWLVPHFEKMLYDNALLAEAYLDGYLATGDRRYARVARETLDYVLRDMPDPAADSTARKMPTAKAKKESSTSGASTKSATILGAEVGRAILPRVRRDARRQFRRAEHPPPAQDAGPVCGDAAVRSAAAGGGDGRRCVAATAAGCGAQRVRPGKDDKILVSWNALMIQALARGAGILDRPDYLAAAQRAARFLLSRPAPPGRPTAALLATRARETGRLSGRLRLSDQRARHALRSRFRRKAGSTRRSALTEIVLRHFPDPADRRVLLHGGRPGVAHHADQGGLRQQRAGQQRDDGHRLGAVWAS